MTRTDIVNRARGALRAGTTYRLGAGAPPSSPTPGDDAGASDCSGYVLWVLGLGRYQPNFQFLQRELGHCWLNTDGIICDARNPTGYFSPSLPNMRLPGDIIVYPGHFYANLIGWKGAGPRIGHVGILLSSTTVIHCSQGNMKRTGDAIAETDLTVFNAVPYSKVLRFSGVL